MNWFSKYIIRGWDVVKKHICIFILIFIFSSIFIGCNNLNNEEYSRFGDVIKVTFTTDRENTNKITIVEKNIIDDIVSMIDENLDAGIAENIEHYRWSHNLILENKTGYVQEIIFSYDALDYKGYLEVDKIMYETDYDFFRYLGDLEAYSKYDAFIEEDVMKLFDMYSWTADYKISDMKILLPDNLKHNAGEYPTKIYWAYNNELSKTVDMDFAEYLNKKVDIETYRLREPLPENFRPRINARGIIVRYDGEIVGAYIDAGRHDSFACSLDRKTIEDITDKSWNEWIDEFIDYEDETEIMLSELTPEEIIKKYYTALDEDDDRLARSCFTRRSLSYELTRNMSNEAIYNKSFESDNINSIKLINLEEFTTIENKEGLIEYVVDVEVDFKTNMFMDDGYARFFLVLEKETEKAGWRIVGIGTGP